ncbi:MAG TPA: hypothetical protein VF696_02700 [Candidatus Paceibacterota bacterium]|jgi:cation:H+ antiporter
MAIFVQIIIFCASVAIVWFFAGMLIESVNRIAQRYCKTGFFTAFFILGALTSISEFSVALNSTLVSVPAVSVGNLTGASLVVMLFIVPLLAVAGKGIALNSAVSHRGLFAILAVIALPVLLASDGDVTRSEGLLSLLAYGAVAFALYRRRRAINSCDPEALSLSTAKPLMADFGRIILGAIAIFAAAHFLVEEAVFFAGVLEIPVSIVALLLLSIGTNIPEIVIAFRAVLSGRSDIAFGDYLGSAAMNTLIFAFLALLNGKFLLESRGFLVTAVVTVLGLGFLYVFARTKAALSRGEGAALLLFYAAFLVLQIVNVFLLSGR